MSASRHPLLGGDTRGTGTDGVPAGTDTPAGTETVSRRALEGQLIESHTNLARALARRFARRGETVEDLEQVALLALVRAARRYDADRANAFSTYATASVLGELKRHFRDRMWVLRVPRSTKELYLRVREARELLSHDLGTSPTIAQVADHLRVGEEDVLDAMEAGESFRPGSLDGAPGIFDEPIEIPAVDESFDQALDRQRLCEILPGLDRRQQTILKGLYFDEMTQREIAREIGISQMQVSRLHTAALASLRREFDPAEP